MDKVYDNLMIIPVLYSPNKNIDHFSHEQK